VKSKASSPNGEADDFFSNATNEVRKHIYADSSSSVEHRYAIGETVNRVCNHAKYGKRGVVNLAKAVHVEEQLLYKCGKVAAAFERQELAIAQAAARKVDFHLSFSALLVLASVNTSELRQTLLTASIDNKWTTRQLLRARDSQSMSVHVGTPKPPIDALTMKARALKAYFQRQLDDAQSLTVVGESDARHSAIRELLAMEALSAKLRSLLLPDDALDEIVSITTPRDDYCEDGWTSEATTAAS